MSDYDIKYFVNDAIFDNVTLITFYAECYKESICIKQLQLKCTNIINIHVYIYIYIIKFTK